MAETPQAVAIRRSVFASRRQWFRRMRDNEQEMLDTFRRASARVEADILRLSVDDVLPPERLTMLRSRLRAQAREMREDLARNLGGQIRDASSTGIEAQMGALDPLLPDPYRAELSMRSFADVDRAAVASVVNRKIDGLGLSDRIWRLSAELEGDALRTIASGVATGRAAHRIASDLRRGTGALKLAAGARPGQYRRAYDNYLRIARTELSRGYSEGTIRWAKEREWAKYLEFTLSFAHPKADICDVYASQNLYGVAPGVYPRDAYPTLPHPHCFCAPLVYPDWQQIFTGENGIEPTRNLGRLKQPQWATGRAQAKWNQLLKQAKGTGQPLTELLPKLVGRKLRGGGTAPAPVAMRPVSPILTREAMTIEELATWAERDMAQLHIELEVEARKALEAQIRKAKRLTTPEVQEAFDIAIENTRVFTREFIEEMKPKLATSRNPAAVQRMIDGQLARLRSPDLGHFVNAIEYKDWEKIAKALGRDIKTQAGKIHELIDTIASLPRLERLLASGSRDELLKFLPDKAWQKAIASRARAVDRAAGIAGKAFRNVDAAQEALGVTFSDVRDRTRRLLRERGLPLKPLSRKLKSWTRADEQNFLDMANAMPERLRAAISAPTRAQRRINRGAVKMFDPESGEDVLSIFSAREKHYDVIFDRARGRASASELGFVNLRTRGTDLRRSMWHEFGHIVEAEDLTAQTRAFKLYAERVREGIERGESFRSLSEISGGYAEDEMSFFDGWADPYMGKFYMDATEIFSMGFEALSSKTMFFKRLAQDPKHMRLVWALLYAP